MACYSYNEYFISAVLAYIIINCSSTVRYYMKMIIFFVGTTVLGIFLMIPRLTISRSPDYRNALLPAWGCGLLYRLLGVSYEVRGIENIQRKEGGVVLMNHQSAIDIAAIACLWPLLRRPTAAIKKEILYMFPLGLAAYLWGVLYIDRSNKADAMNKLNQESRRIRENAANLIIFPEGTRNQGDKLLPFKKGAFHIAVQSESSIQPAVISRYWYLDGKKKIFSRGHSIIHILPEISCKGMSKDDVSTLLEKTQQLMQTEYEKLNAETYPMHSESG